jgi:hypothetical protein
MNAASAVCVDLIAVQNASAVKSTVLAGKQPRFMSFSLIH